MSIVTRFAPSPTGMLHIGGARTALINALFSASQGGKFLIRIEDTDRKRSTPEAISAIEEGLHWLDLLGDAPFVFQSSRFQRHQEVAQKLVAEGKAYRCCCSPDQLQSMRAEARAQGRTRVYDRRHRDANISEEEPHVVRLKVPTTGESIIEDLVQGTMTVAHDHLDDYILLREDKSPTYMLSCVVDDADMGITHIIRGDDHINNAHRQRQLIHAAGFPEPQYAHIALLHGADGAKLSKRHGALGIEHYRQAGYLKEAIQNYLIRLGWGKGEEILSFAEATEIFSLSDLNKAPARVDLTRLNYFNAHHMRKQSLEAPEQLLATLQAFSDIRFNSHENAIMQRGITGLCSRTETLSGLRDLTAYYLHAPVWPLQDAKAQKQFLNKAVNARLDILLQNIPDWVFEDDHALKAEVQEHAELLEVGFGSVGQPLRIALCGTMQAPDIGAILYALGKDETIERLSRAQEFLNTQD